MELTYRIDEVERANLSAEEKEEVERDHAQVANMQMLTEQMSIAIQALSEGESAVYERLYCAASARKIRGLDAFSRRLEC